MCIASSGVNSSFGSGCASERGLLRSFGGGSEQACRELLDRAPRRRGCTGELASEEAHVGSTRVEVSRVGIEGFFEQSVRNVALRFDLSCGLGTDRAGGRLGNVENSETHFGIGVLRVTSKKSLVSFTSNVDVVSGFVSTARLYDAMSLTASTVLCASSWP